MSSWGRTTPEKCRRQEKRSVLHIRRGTGARRTSLHGGGVHPRAGGDDDHGLCSHGGAERGGALDPKKASVLLWEPHARTAATSEGLTAAQASIGELSQ